VQLPKFVKPAESLCVHVLNIEYLVVVETFQRMLFNDRKYSSTCR